GDPLAVRYRIRHTSALGVSGFTRIRITRILVGWNGVPRSPEEGPFSFMARPAALKFAFTCFLLAALTGPGSVQGRTRADRPVDSNSATVAVSELPRQGRETYELILQGGPFPYDKDGSVFGNRER